MRRTAYVCGLALLGACGADATRDARITQMTPDAIAGSGAVSDKPIEVSNPSGVLTTVMATPMSAAAGNSGGMANTADCEIGKFCAPAVPDPDNCGTLTLGQNIQVKKVPGNLLVVFD